MTMLNLNEFGLQRKSKMYGKLIVLSLSILVSAKVLGWEPMVLENGHIRVNSTIGGIEGYSIIDTGAEMNAINSIFIHVNKLAFDRGNFKVRVGGVYGEETRRTYRRVPVTLWGTEIPFRDLVDLNLRNKDLQMLLGAGFLANFVFQFDYPNQRMRALPRGAVDMKKVKNVKSKRDPGGGSPLVQVKLDGRPIWLTLDTGNSSGVLVNRSMAVKEGWLDKYQVRSTTGFGAVSGGERISFNLESLEIGPFELENPIVSVPPKGEVWNLFEKSASTSSRVHRSRGKSRGLLGYDVLKHFVVTIDYKGGQVHLAPPESL